MTYARCLSAELNGVEEPTPKGFRSGTERVVDPASTLERARSLMRNLQITRIANITGLDTIGIPVVTVYRPNSRSISVSQGKGATLVAAEVSGLMESIESHHAERIRAPLLLGSYRELKSRHRVARTDGLPKLSVSCFHDWLPILWVPGIDLISGERLLLPYEVVHTDFRLPLPTGSGAFVMSSNGLASGNHLSEALSHAICELVERDANTLWNLSGKLAQGARRLELSTVDDGVCQGMLEQFARAQMAVAVWETTSDIGISSFLCTVVEREDQVDWTMPPVSGSGCHPRRAIALLRALTEAAQGRLTIIAGARDDLSQDRFDSNAACASSTQVRHRIANEECRRSFDECPDVNHDSFEADIRWELESLSRCGIGEVVSVNLTIPEFGIPVVRVVAPYLEAMSELVGYVPGRRGRKAMTEATP